MAFFYVNGWAVKAAATAVGGSSNPLGTQLSRVFLKACAGGAYFLGSSAQGYAMNAQVSDLSATSAESRAAAT